MDILKSIVRVLRPGNDAKDQTALRKDDRRLSNRRPQRMKSGFLWCQRLIKPRACMIRDISVSGARVEVMDEPIKMALLANGVKFYLSSEKHEYDCRVAWAKGNLIGLQFESAPRSPSRSYR